MVLVSFHPDSIRLRQAVMAFQIWVALISRVSVLPLAFSIAGA